VNPPCTSSSIELYPALQHQEPLGNIIFSRPSRGRNFSLDIHASVTAHKSVHVIRRYDMNHFTIRNSLALALITSTMGFAQDSVSASRIKAIASSVTADTVDVQHVVNAYHDAVLNHDGLVSLASSSPKPVCGSTYFPMTRTLVRKPNHRMPRRFAWEAIRSSPRWFLPPKPASVQRTRIFRRTATARSPLCILTSSSWQTESQRIAAVRLGSWSKEVRAGELQQ
jgi:hypothetical protein